MVFLFYPKQNTILWIYATLFVFQPTILFLLQGWRLEWVQRYQQNHHSTAHQDRVQNCIPLPVQQSTTPCPPHLVRIKWILSGVKDESSLVQPILLIYPVIWPPIISFILALRNLLIVMMTLPLQVPYTQRRVYQDRGSRSSSVLLWSTDQSHFSQTFC